MKLAHASLTAAAPVYLYLPLIHDLYSTKPSNNLALYAGYGRVCKLYPRKILEFLSGRRKVRTTHRWPYE